MYQKSAPRAGGSAFLLSRGGAPIAIASRKARVANSTRDRANGVYGADRRSHGMGVPFPTRGFAHHGLCGGLELPFRCGSDWSACAPFPGAVCAPVNRRGAGRPNGAVRAFWVVSTLYPQLPTQLSR